jgi:hypothetical protein
MVDVDVIIFGNNTVDEGPVLTYVRGLAALVVYLSRSLGFLY